jgi:excisionase family DNA binding protein
MQAADRRWLSVRQTAEFLGLHPKTVYDLAARGKIPSAKIGGALRIDLRRLTQDLEGQEKRRQAVRPAVKAQGKSATPAEE